MRILQPSGFACLLLSCGLFFAACTQQVPTSPTVDRLPDLQKRGGRWGNAEGGDSQRNDLQITFPLFASKVFTYDIEAKQYRGGTLNLADGSKFHVFEGSLTPPHGTPHGAAVEITMTVEKKPGQNELVFTFGPSGALFDPPAEIWLCWSSLGSKRPSFYYIDDHGNYIPQMPDEIDMQGKRFVLRVNHFSRYAIAHSQ